MRRPASPPKGGRRTRETTPHPPFFNGEVSVGNGVYYLVFPNGNVFGYYSYSASGNYIYHFDMGWEYYQDANDANHGIYMYDFPSDHWLYTSPQYPFPYLYDFSYNATLYYYPDTSRPGHYTTNPRYFYNFGTSQIIKMPDPAVPTHVQNWSYACHPGGTCVGEVPHNVGIPETWLASSVDWNEVSASGDLSGQYLSSAGAKHIVPYVDPNITPYCGAPPSGTTTDVPETGANCQGAISQYLHPQNGSYAHAYQHRDNGNRLIRTDGTGAPFLYNGQLFEPYNIGDSDVQSAFATTTSLNAYATEILEDDAGGAYNCIMNYGRCDSGASFDTAHYGTACTTDSYWCYKYNNTAVEWDNAPSTRGLSPQQAYVNDAIALSGRSAHPVIGNSGAQTNTYDVQWASSSNVKGVMIEGAWTRASNTYSSVDATHWVGNANGAIFYHGLQKPVVELSNEDLSADPGRLLFQIASHWIVYDPQYSIEALIEDNPAPSNPAWSHDATFSEQSVLPTGALRAPGSTVSTFQTAPSLYVREFSACYQSGVPLGRCAAVVNIGTSATAITGLTASYGHQLVRNTSATWSNGGTAQWSTTVPTSIASGQGIILAQ